MGTDASMINWEAVGAIGSWACGIATFLAVIVSLWQTKLSKQVSLKLDFSYNFLYDQLGNRYNTGALRVMNVGGCQITVEEWGFVLNDNSHLTVIPNQIAVGAKLPITVTPNSSAQLLVPMQKLKDALEPVIKKNLISVNDKLNVYVRDDFSRYYNLKTKAKVSDVIKVATM